MLDIFIGILKDQFDSKLTLPRGIPFPKYDAFCSALLDINRRLNDIKGDKSHFVMSVERYFDGLEFSAEIRSTRSRKDSFQSGPFYLRHRSFGVGATTSYELLALLNNVELAQRIRSGLKFQLMTETMTSIIIILNDIVSTHKELKDQEDSPDNIVLLHHRRLATLSSSPSVQSSLLQDAFAYAANLYNNELTDFINLGKTLTTESNALNEYYRILLMGLRDNIDWYFIHSIRYGLDNAHIKYMESQNR